MKFRLALVVVLLCFAGAAGAAGAVGALPVLQPDGPYADDDHSARYLPTPPGDRARFRRQINATIQNNPRNTAALAQRAYLFMESGDLKRARRDFDQALAVSEPGGPHERNVLWSRGWASYELEDYAATLDDWQRAIALHGGKPFWASYSLALLYWTTGQPAVALQWYANAVASSPEWGTPDGVERRIRRWAPPQQARMRALFAAWQQASEPAADTAA